VDYRGKHPDDCLEEDREKKVKRDRWVSVQRVSLRRKIPEKGGAIK